MSSQHERQRVERNPRLGCIIILTTSIAFWGLIVGLLWWALT